ncbi:MAG: alpha/beta hydrolase [Solobacterium sp.]|nr:alpha/beta hydrolase [Solobacterium sp.]
MSKLGVLFWRHVFESGDSKRLAQQVQDLTDLHIIRDIPYIDDGEQGHLFDLYELPGLDRNAPVMINIHGGGLFASYKEVNVNFNYEWARMGYRVISISYRRIPETTMIRQVEDVMAALRFLKKHAEEYSLDLNSCFLTGDSAGALLSLFALSIGNSEKLQKEFGIRGHDIAFRAAGTISIMLDTQRRDLMRAVSNVVTDRNDRGQAYEKYLKDPAKLLNEAKLPPLFLVTSEEDLIRKDTVKFAGLLKAHGCRFEMKDFAKGTDHKLVHVFPVMYPMYTESREVFDAMSAYFREAE